MEGSGNGASLSMGIHKGNVRHLAMKGSANMFIGLVLVPDLEGHWLSFWSQHFKGYFCLSSGKLDAEVTRKTLQSSILAFIKAVGLG
jgi:hypothetical protein